jgi:hypothetical protein
MVRVFVSGTYKDLVEYRMAALKHLDRISEYHKVSMEIMGVSDRNAVEKSLEDLDTCQVFLGIIGHRYGTILPNYDDKSITQLEYEKALSLHQVDAKRMRILLYLADENKIPLPVNLREDDQKFKKQSEFRTLLQTRHVPQLFDSISDLISRVSVDLSKVFNDVDIRRSMQYTVFDETELERVYEEIDAATQDRLNKVESFLRFTAETFGSVFDLAKNYASHPFFRIVREKLSSVIPGLSLNPEHGVLKRANVRHVIVRIETLLPILLMLDCESLWKAGAKAGFTAAGDLINHTLRPRKYVPASPQVFIALWDFWDRTGGWGEMKLVEEGPPWKIKIANSFLTIDQDLLKTHNLSHFWCGYIHGFLNQSLPLLGDLIAELDPEQAKKVALPAYKEVSEVKHLENGVINEDFFIVSFKESKFSETLRKLIAAKSMIEHNHLEFALRWCVEAIIQSKRDLSDDRKWTQGISAMDIHIDIRNALLRAVPETSTESTHNIANILRPITPDSITTIFHQTNQFVQQLVQGDNQRGD